MYLHTLILVLALNVQCGIKSRQQSQVLKEYFSFRINYVLLLYEHMQLAVSRVLAEGHDIS